MELEVKKSHGREETVRNWSDKDIKQMHRERGYDWRSNRTKLRVLKVTDQFRDNYDSIFRKKD